MWNSVIELFRSYMGTGLVVSFFLVAIIFSLFHTTIILNSQQKFSFALTKSLYTPFMLLSIDFVNYFSKNGTFFAFLKN